MLKQRNKTATVLLAFLPGAGHMFMGFMKRGVSFMALFFLTIFFTAWLRIGPLIFLLPILWFYAFFECVNLAWASPDEFSLAKDDYLFRESDLPRLSGSWSLCGGILLIVFGVYMILERLLSYFSDYADNALYQALDCVISLFPQFLVGTIIIIIGIHLILGKKKELKDDV
jgi:hypothetical protein